MADEPKSWKNALVIDKAIKEKKDGDEYLVFEIKEKQTDKYAKKFSLFAETEEELEEGKTVKKGDVIDLEFTEKEGMYQGKPITYRNILHIEVIEEMKVAEEKPTEQKETTNDLEQKEIDEAVAYTIKIAIAVKECWIENFLNDERLKEIPQEEKVSIFSTMFIQASKLLSQNN